VLCASFAVAGGPGARREPFTPRPTDAALYKRIDKARLAAEKIKIDGKGDDWLGIPEFSDPPNDVQSDAGRDIVSAAIAPRADELLIMVRTAQLPSQESHAFWFNIDFMGLQGEDVQIGLSKDGMHTLWIFEEGKPQSQSQFRGLEVMIHDVVEVRISYKTLAEALPAKMRPFLTGELARPVVRVTPFSYDARTKQFIDYGPAVASFRLLPTPFPLDPPPPKNLKAVKSIELPVNGKWFVGNGPFGIATHQDVFAYDLYIVDHTGHPSGTRESKRNTDYMSWDQPVIAPVAGRVVFVKKDGQDETPRLPNTAKVTDANRVLLDIGDSLALELVHFSRNSVKVSAGQSISAGKFLGNIGNSGQTTWPHLHLALWKQPESKVTLPLGLTNVRVSLNHAGEDPWAREFPAWDLREGYFVERIRK
jgi:murein DD-endopeptidase MepM/ murein hydrolase activator NlpD